MVQVFSVIQSDGYGWDSVCGTFFDERAANRLARIMRRVVRGRAMVRDILDGERTLYLDRVYVQVLNVE